MRAYAHRRTSHLGNALIFSVVGHSVALVVVLASPRWPPVPDTAASTMDAIEVQLFSTVVTSSRPPERVYLPAPDIVQASPPDVEPSVPNVEMPQPKLKPEPVAEPKIKIRKVEAPKSLPASALQELPPSKSSVDPKTQPDPIVPPALELVQADEVDTLPAPDSPTSSVKESVDTLLDLLKAAMNVSEPMASTVPLPAAPTLAELSEVPDMRSKTTEVSEAAERVQETVKEALKDVAVPAPLERLVPIQETPKLAKLSEISETLPNAVRSPVAQERVREVMKEALKDVVVPAPLEPLTQVPAPRRLVEPPENSAILPAHKSVKPVRMKERFQATVTKALEQVERPSPMANPEPLDVAAIPPSTVLAPFIHSEFKEIRERNETVVNERATERQAPSDDHSSGFPPMMEEDARWKRTFAEYAGRVKMAIDRNWHWQGNNDLALRVAVSFRLFPDGRATRVAISQTSGNQIFDRAAIRAVKQLKRLPPFPRDIEREFLDVVMEFSKVRAS